MLNVNGLEFYVNGLLNGTLKILWVFHGLNIGAANNVVLDYCGHVNFGTVAM
jgi:hypothetical protein